MFLSCKSCMDILQLGLLVLSSALVASKLSIWYLGYLLDLWGLRPVPIASMAFVLSTRL
jgi:hypothetical protein